MQTLPPREFRRTQGRALAQGGMVAFACVGFSAPLVVLGAPWWQVLGVFLLGAVGGALYLRFVLARAEPDEVLVEVGDEGIHDHRLSRELLPWDAIARVRWGFHGVALELRPEGEALLAGGGDADSVDRAEQAAAPFTRHRLEPRTTGGRPEARVLGHDLGGGVAALFEEVERRVRDRETLDPSGTWPEVVGPALLPARWLDPRRLFLLVVGLMACAFLVMVLALRHVERSFSRLGNPGTPRPRISAPRQAP